MIPLLLGTGWLSTGVMEGEGQLDLRSLVAYQNSLGFLTWQGSRSVSGLLQDLFKWRNRLHLLMGGDALSHYQRSGYK